MAAAKSTMSGKCYGKDGKMSGNSWHIQPVTEAFI
jgi:hypothetical protein